LSEFDKLSAVDQSSNQSRHVNTAFTLPLRVFCVTATKCL